MTLESVTPSRAAPNALARPELIHLASLHVAVRLKAIWEWLAAAVGLVFVIPLLVPLAIWIRLDSRGPVFFRQTRIGRDGIPFTLIKLRTMYVDADVTHHPGSSPADPDGTKRPNDPRVTRAGRILRRCSLDELPQLFNVLTGKMALIGPRPPLPHEMRLYPEQVWPRFTVRPGITGLWQVSGRADLGWHEAGRLDLAYVEGWSLRRDLWILVRTIPAVLGGRGAY